MLAKNPGVDGSESLNAVAYGMELECFYEWTAVQPAAPDTPEKLSGVS